MGDQLTDLDFFVDADRCIFRHIEGVLNLRQVADVATAFDAIQKSNEVDQASGLEYLTKIMALAPTAAIFPQSRRSG